jgi:hypothetical protein
MQPIHGFAAQTVAASVIELATAWGLPVSTTQVVSGSVMGAGATRRFSAVRWGLARRIVWAWVFTIPAAAILAALAALLIEAGPVAVTLAVLVMGGIVIAKLVRRSRTRKPGADDFVVGAMEDLGKEDTSTNGDGQGISDERQDVATAVTTTSEKTRHGGR